MVAYLKKELRAVQNALIRSGMSQETLAGLNVRGGVIAELLDWAKRRPEKGEAQE